MPAKLKKICRRCNKEKTFDEFCHNKDSEDYHDDICAVCLYPKEKPIDLAK